MSRPVGRYRIQEFDPTTAFDKPRTVVVLARRNSGKSVWIRDILYHLHRQKFPRVVVFSGTEESNHFYGSHIPPAYIHDHFDLDKLAEIVATQKQVVSAVRDLEEKLGRPTGIDTRLLLILDDCVYQRHVLSNEIVRSIFFNGRHHDISLFLTSQYLMLIPIEQRGNIDFIVCLKEPVPKNKAKLYDSFFGVFPDRRTFNFVFDTLTADYCSIVFDNTVPDIQPENSVKWYKASPDLPPFKFHQVCVQKP